MKKILSLLTVLSLTTQFAFFANGCDNNNKLNLKQNLGSKFKASDLNTWGKTQKNIINNVYIDAVKQSHLLTWEGWIKHNKNSSSLEERALVNALHKINPSLYIRGIRKNIIWSYLNTPSNQDYLKSVLAKGIQLSIASINGHENFNVEIKGFIPSIKKFKPLSNVINLSEIKTILLDKYNLYASLKYPIYLSTPKSGKLLAKNWDKYCVASDLSEQWSWMGGLTSCLYPYVQYKHIDIIKHQPRRCEMYFINSKEYPNIAQFLGYTKKHPRVFWIEGN